ncbi:MAG: GIY-YIG nuclease family protein, partial [Ruminococcus sp.]|nr:GIY-YIG nuclease family protein [Ruminococcus sp.]
MTKGIIYIMETVVPGLIKIGKTASDNFEQRMYNLERNGYNNVVGLKRRFAIEVEEYSEKEVLIHSLFDKSRLKNSELFAIDIDLVIQLLTSFEGKQIYPENETKEQVFADATESKQVKANITLIPNILYLERTIKNIGKINAIGHQTAEGLVVMKGSHISPESANSIPNKIKETRETAKLTDGSLQEDM